MLDSRRVQGQHFQAPEQSTKVNRETSQSKMVGDPLVLRLRRAK